MIVTVEPGSTRLPALGVCRITCPSGAMLGLFADARLEAAARICCTAIDRW